MIEKPVIAIDPGGTTGIAIRIPAGQILTVTYTDVDELIDFLFENDFQHVIVENFMAQTIGKYGLHTVRLVGGAYAIARAKKAGYTLHMPQDRYPFLKPSEDFLKERRARANVKFVVHEKDALAHLFRWEHDNGIRFS